MRNSYLLDSYCPSSTLPAAPSATASALVITSIASLIAAITAAAAKVMTGLALGLPSGAAVLHAREHGIHLAHVHLRGVNARCHHLLHHLLHLGRRAFHAWHTAGRVTATATTAWHSHATHHHGVELVHHLLVIGGKHVGAKLASHGLLLVGVQRPCKLVKTVVEVVANIGAWFAPWLFVIGEVYSRCVSANVLAPLRSESASGTDLRQC